MCADTGPFGSELILTQIHKTGGMFGLGVGSRTDQAFVDGDSTSGGSRCLIRARRTSNGIGGVFVLAGWAGRASKATVTTWATVVQNPGIFGDGGGDFGARLIFCFSSKKNDAVVESTGHFVEIAWCHLCGQLGPFPGRGARRDGFAVEQPSV